MNCKLIVPCILGLHLLHANSDTNYSWTATDVANWGDSVNWSPTTVPNDSSSTAIFDNDTSGTIVINGTFDIGTLYFGTQMFDNYNLSSPDGSTGVLNLYMALTNASMGESEQTPYISCELNLQGSVAINGGQGGFTFNGPITGTGGLTVNSGLLYFLDTGVVNYSGTTTINNGSVEAGAPYVFSPNSAFVLADNAGALLTPGGSNNVIASLAGGAASGVGLMGATLTIGDSTNTVYSGTISDGGGNPGGGIQKVGTGTLTLNGNNTYSGNTDVSGGTLVLSGINSFVDSSTVNVTLGHLTIGNNNSLGLATLTLANSTTLELSSGIVIPNAVTVTGNVNLLVDAGMGTLAGNVGGNGSLIKTGPGSLTLSGNNTFTGTTTLIEGSLVVSGSTTSQLNILAGSILRGTGTFGPIDVNQGGTIAPGNSVGTITASSIAFDPDSFFQVEINPEAASLLNITGTASLSGGQVQVDQDPGSYPIQGKYLILEASSITGSFNPHVLGGFNGYVFSLDQTNNNLYLLYSILIPTDKLSGNALKVAHYLNDHGSFSTIALLSSLSENSLKNAMNSISPARNAFGTYITEQTAFSLSTLLSNHIDNEKISRKESFHDSLIADASDRILTKKKPDSKFSLWISGFGECAHQKAKSQTPSFNYISEAALAGLDYQIGKKDLVGGALGYAHTYFYDDESTGHGSINYYFLSVYGRASIHQFYLSPAIWSIFNQTENTRNITFPNFSKKAQADIFAWQMIPHLETGYDFKYVWGGFTPFTSVDWAISWQRSYTETGAAPFNSSQKANNGSMVRSETGLKFCEKWQKNFGTFFLKEKISYVFEKPFGVGTTRAFFTGTPGSFTVNALTQNLNLTAVGLEFLLALGKKQSVFLSLAYDGEFGINYRSNDLTLNLTHHF